MNESRWMLYGAYGHTGRLIAAEAVERGHRPILAGRNPKRLRPVAEELGLDWVEADLAQLGAVLSGLEPARAILNVAGPFTRTAGPVLDACLEGGAHYLDITGEVSVLEGLFRRSSEVRAAGVSAVPAVGFDVVPTDSLARRLREALPTAVRLELAFHSPGGPSRGTLRTMLEHLPEGVLRRRGGILIRGRLGEDGRMVPFPDRARYAIPITWGDLSTAYRTTEIQDIVTCMSMSPRRARQLRWMRPVLNSLLSVPALRRTVQACAGIVTRDPGKRRKGRRSWIWGRVESPDGRSAWGGVDTPEGYRFTAQAAVRAVERVLAGVERGVLTPTQAFGVDFLNDLPDTRVLGPYLDAVPHPSPAPPAR